jgi:hypothetical protein
MKVLILIFLFLTTPLLSAVDKAEMVRLYKAGNDEQVLRNYNENQESILNGDETVVMIVSYSMARKGQYLDGINLRNKLINLKFKDDHKKFLSSFKKNESIDAEKIPKNLKLIYFSNFKDYSKLLLRDEGDTSLNKKKFDLYGKLLSNLEFQEGKVDKIAEETSLHFSQVQGSRYYFQRSVFVDYLMWQQNGELIQNGVSYKTVLTNKAICPGGELSYKNEYTRFFLDACFVYGTGNTSTVDSTTAPYNELNVAVTGFKTSLGFGKVISSQGAELGLKLPILYASQVFQQPTPANSACTGTCKVTNNKNPQVLINAYARWPFGKFFVQSELGKPITQDTLFWAIGFGYKF